MSLRDFGLLTLVCLVWASNNIVSKYVVSHLGLPPLFYAALRFAVVAIATAPWLLPHAAATLAVAGRGAPDGRRQFRPAVPGAEDLDAVGDRGDRPARRADHDPAFDGHAGRKDPLATRARHSPDLRRLRGGDV